MNIAIITTTGQQVEVIAVNGGWTTVHTLGADTREMKVRNGALSGHTTLTDTVAELALARAEETARGALDVAQAQVTTERKNGKIDPLYLQFYTSYAVELADGTTRRSIDKGDALAVKLRGMELISVYAEVSNITGQSITDLRARFTHLNPGMQRMSLGNMARKFMKAAV